MTDPGRVFISYRSPHRLYGLCWGTKPNDLRVAASTFIPEEYVNKLQVRSAAIMKTGVTAHVVIASRVRFD